MGKNRKPHYFFSKMSGEELFDYIARSHRGKSSTEFDRADKAAYNFACKRGLIGKLVADKILVRKGGGGGKGRKSFFQEMNHNQLVDYVAQHYAGKSITEFIESGYSAYKTMVKNGLINELVNKGILVRKTKGPRVCKPRGQWKDLNFAVEQAKKLMYERKFENLPPSNKLVKMGYSGLVVAIQRYYGGLIRFREILNQRLGTKSGKKKLERMIDEYIGGEDE